jgi:hypothetical protein
MRSRNLIILAAVVAVVGAFIGFFERHQPTTDERAERADRVLGSLDEDEVASLVVRSPRGAVRLERTGDDWRLVEPVDYPADDDAVRSLLRSIGRLDVERTLPAGDVEAGAYGVDEPALGLELVTTDGTRHTLAIGDETALGGRRAVRRDGEADILLVASTFADELDRELDDWRSRSVVDVLEADLLRIEVEAPPDLIRAVRTGDRWRLESPLVDLADQEQLRSLVSELDDLRISEFLPSDADAAQLGLDPPEYRVELVPEGGREPITLELAAPAGDQSTVVCRRNGSELFTVPETIRARLAKAPVRWRSAAVWPFASWDAVKLEITAADGEELVLDRVDGMWRLAGGGEADDAEVRRRLAALADLEALDHDLMLPPTEVMGSVIVVLEEEGAAEGLTYTFYAPLEEGGHAAVTVSARAGVMGIEAALAETVVGDLGALRRPVAETVAAE